MRMDTNIFSLNIIATRKPTVVGLKSYVFWYHYFCGANGQKNEMILKIICENWVFKNVKATRI